MITTLLYFFFILFLISLIIVRFAHLVYPIDTLKVGDIVDVFLDGEHNRSATISSVKPKFITIYDRLPLPVHYRGRFYAVGYMEDGKLIYLSNRRLYFLARVAELIRKIGKTPEFKDQLPPDVEAVNETITENEEEDQND